MPALGSLRLFSSTLSDTRRVPGAPELGIWTFNRRALQHSTLCMAATKPVAVISGAARTHGIGRGCANAFLQAGYHVIALDNQPEEKPIQDGDFEFHTVDITNPDQTQALAAEVKRMHKDVRVLINNAGIADPYMPDGVAERVAHWNRVIQTNLTGAFLLSESLLPHMAPGQSSIIYMSSIRADQSEPTTEAYAAAKAGLIGLTHAQAVSLAHKVRVNAVLPGWIDTIGKPEGITQQDHDWHLTGKVGVPDDIAQMCLFLADHKKSGFITGQHFLVDGGISKKLIYPD